MRATITRYESLPRVHPPSHVTRQLPKYDPSANGRFQAEELGLYVHGAGQTGLDTVMSHELGAVKWRANDIAAEPLDFMGAPERSCPL